MSVLAPSPTPVIGREDELAEARGLLLGDLRLLTITGPPGVGKTRFALALAHECADEFLDGSAFVGLASVTDRALVGPTIAQELGLRPEGETSPVELLRLWLGSREQLLVLDNFEQVAAAAPLVADLVAACPGLTLLVTSRQPLRLTAEREFPLRPLAEADAVALFRERARSVAPDLETGTSTIAEICSRLDRLPLAIELAAARVKLLSPAALLERLEPRLEILKGGPRDLPLRQQTLRATLDWSYDLLDQTEQRLLRGLSVFVGGCTIEAAETVCGATLDGLASLIDKNLLSRDENRLTMLELIREYGLEQLAECAEQEAARLAHAAWCLALVEDAEPKLTSAEREASLDRLEQEYANLRAAFWFALGSEEEHLPLRLAAALWRFWFERGRIQEGRRWLTEALAADPTAPPAARVKALVGASMLAHEDSDVSLAAELGGDALALAHDIGDQTATAAALLALARVAASGGEVRAARGMLEQALSDARASGDRWLTARLLNHLGGLESRDNERNAAVRRLDESVALFREVGDELGAARSLQQLAYTRLAAGDEALAVQLIEQAYPALLGGSPRDAMWGRAGRAMVDFVRGDYARAQASLAESTPLLRQLGNPAIIAEALVDHAELAARDGREESAVRLVGASDAIVETLGISLAPFFRTNRETALSIARGRLGEATVAAAHAAGHALTVEQALTEIDRVVAAAGGAGDDLTGRELEVVRLVADGLSNADIAARLVVSTRTVHAHLRSVYRKLGVHTRTAAARAARERELV